MILNSGLKQKCLIILRSFLSVPVESSNTVQSFMLSTMHSGPVKTVSLIISFSISDIWGFCSA